MMWICIAYKINKNCTMQIKCIYIKNSNNFQSVFSVRREDTYCAVFKKNIVNAFSNISKEYVRSCHFAI
jgi:hypothetical protein